MLLSLFYSRGNNGEMPLLMYTHTISQQEIFINSLKNFEPFERSLYWSSSKDSARITN